MAHFLISGPGIEPKIWGFPDVDVFVVGRAPSCELALPDRAVSNIHAAIVRIPGPDEQYFVRDLGSRDSVQVRGENVYQRTLEEDDCIDIAGYSLVFGKGAAPGCALPRFRVELDRGNDSGMGGATTPAREVRSGSMFDAGGEEILDQIAHFIRRGCSLESLLAEFMPRILGYISADPLPRASVVKFTFLEGLEYREVAAFGLRSEDQIGVADRSFLDCLARGEIVRTDRTLLVPIRSQNSVWGFIGVQRSPSSRPFLPEHGSLLLRVGEFVISGTEPSSSTQYVSPPDTLQEWPTSTRTIIGNSPAIKAMMHKIQRVAPTEHTVLVLGESGTGKELVAHQIHKYSRRRERPFLAVNCAALSESLLESELFGHEKGAFTNAYQQKKGLFERAHNSTLLLDEIGDTSLAMQAKILRVLQENELIRVGGTEVIKVNVRIIAATNKNLEQEVKLGKFRGDLYYRLKVVPILSPPLRDRREDIPVLVFYFLDRYAAGTGSKTRSVSHHALELLTRYDWPGNVRELEYCVKNGVTQNTEIILSSDLAPAILEPRASDTEGKHSGEEIRKESGPPHRVELKPLKDIVKEAIQNTLTATGGNIARTAEILEIAEMTVRNRMKALGIPVGYGRA